MFSKALKYFLSVWVFLAMSTSLSAGVVSQADSLEAEAAPLDVKELILEHLKDDYEWHIATYKDKDISIPLPVILFSKNSGVQLFSSAKFHQNKGYYKGFYISKSGKYKGKIVETDASGNEIRPIDLSLTKNALSLLIGSFLLILLMLFIARTYKNEPIKPKKGVVGAMEVFILSVYDDVIKPVLGEDYKEYRYYLLTLFFFIFFNNILGLVPIFPGGANVTGNISVTFTLALCTFLIVNLTGTKEYYKSIFWPDVPVWLKFPLPLMIIIELVGLITKPFALMIRLFANIMAGHAIVLGLVSLIFITAGMGAALSSSMTGFSVVLTIFIYFIEILVAYIQAYVFTTFTAVFISGARVKSPKTEKSLKST